MDVVSRDLVTSGTLLNEGGGWHAVRMGSSGMADLLRGRFIEWNHPSISAIRLRRGYVQQILTLCVAAASAFICMHVVHDVGDRVRVSLL